MKRALDVQRAFAQSGRGGNLAGVVLDAAGLSQQQKQAVAARAALSETAFILPSRDATVRGEFYTPIRQIAFCGHATIAAFAALAQAGRIEDGRHSMKNMNGSITQVDVQAGEVFMRQSAPVFEKMPPELSAVLGLRKGQQHADFPVLIGGAGNRFAYVPVADMRSLRALKPDMGKLARLSEKYNLVGAYPFVPLERGLRDAAARMFAPAYGIFEEAATGMAAGPLAAYLRMVTGGGKDEYVFAQGALMQPSSPSKLTVRLSRDPGEIWVGGSVVPAGRIGLD